MKKMTKEEIIHQVIVDMQTQRHFLSMQRIAHAVCQMLKIVPYQFELAECICGESRLRNDEAVVKWLLLNHDGHTESSATSIKECASKLEKHIIKQLPPYDIGDLYE